MKRCTFNEGKHHCGSYAFNLYNEGIKQGKYCDRHYWQDQAQKARSWVGLTDDEMWELWNAEGNDAMNQQEAIAFARATNTKLKEKNT